MIYRCILPEWALKEQPHLQKVLEGDFAEEKLDELNKLGYNIYLFPNYPSYYSGKNVSGEDVDVFNLSFIDMDLKDGKYANKEEFLEKLSVNLSVIPTAILDSGNGIHAYWEVSDLDAMSYLKLNRRLCRYFGTDPAVSKICQLMRAPGYNNTKNKDDIKLCYVISETDNVYTCEQLDRVLPPLSLEDKEYCEQHYAKTYNTSDSIQIEDKIPKSFHDLMRSNKEVKACYLDPSDDRSVADYRLGHLMFAAKISKADAMSVLINAQKALTRAPKHRISYAQNIVDKIWTYELEPNKELNLSLTMRQVINRGEDKLNGDRFACHEWIDNTARGFRLGQVLGLVAGSGVGKTAIALNLFRGFASRNPEYHHFFVSLEQPINEIAQRWKVLCGDDDRLHDKVHVISNYAEDGTFRHLSFEDIKDYIILFQNEKKVAVGCVVIDHIGALKKGGAKSGESQDLMDICHKMKAFAVQTNTFLIMQSQTNRSKAGIGDIELDKDAAFGTVFFESYCDYLVTLWQPFKRCYGEGAPTITAFKFCKIRHKNQKKDALREDVRYTLFFDPDTGSLRELVEDEEKGFSFWNNKCANARKRDKKTDTEEYIAVKWKEGSNGETDNNNNSEGTTGVAEPVEISNIHVLRH